MLYNVGLRGAPEAAVALARPKDHDEGERRLYWYYYHYYYHYYNYHDYYCCDYCYYCWLIVVTNSR